MTARTSARLRWVFLVVAALLAGLTGPVWARSAPVKVLVGATVSDDARAAMSQPFWMKMVSDWVSAVPIPFKDGLPDLAACRKAGADFLVSAPFDLRPRLPGMLNSTGRVAARSNLIVTNCITDAVVYDQTIAFDSEPVSSPESAPDAAWSKSVPASFAKAPIFFGHVARVVQVTSPTALVDFRENVKSGDLLRVYADSGHHRKGPILLVVTQQLGKYTEVTFPTLAGAMLPAKGDYVEPAPKPSP
jgi:hypothetical protein